MSEEIKTWYPAGIYKGIFEGFIIEANRHISEDGQETAWHTVSYCNTGDYGHRDYWIINSQFRKTLKKTMNTSGAFRNVTDGIISDPPDAERQAILKAIKEWATREPDVS